MLLKLQEFAHRQPAPVVLAALLALGGFGFFLNIIEDVVTGDTGRVDRLLLVRAHHLSRSTDGNWLTPLAHAASLLGNWQVLIPLGLVLLWRGVKQREKMRDFVYYAGACAGCAALVLGFKYLIGRPRPQVVPTLEDAPFLSFPSGHTVYALVAWGFVAYIIARRPQTSLGLRVLLLLLVLTIAGLVGASRIYLAAHYPSDVAGGLLMAIPWLIVVVFMYERRGDKRGGSMKRST